MSDPLVSVPSGKNDGELHPEPLPVVPIPQDPFLPKSRLRVLVQRIVGAQFVRYVLVGGFNTVFGYGLFVVFLAIINHLLPGRYTFHGARLAALAPVASILSTPVAITVAYLGYKFIVFRTKGNYLREWFKCFAVYGTGMIPGLVALGGLTRLLQSMIHSHATSLHSWVGALEQHLDGPLLTLAHRLDHGPTLAANLAGALVTAVSTLYSYVGHRKVTFRQAKPAGAIG